MEKRKTFLLELRKYAFYQVYNDAKKFNEMVFFVVDFLISIAEGLSREKPFI